MEIKNQNESIIIDISNNKYVIRDVVLAIIFGVFGGGFFSLINGGFEWFLMVFNLGLFCALVSFIMSKLSVNCNERLIITDKEITIKFGAFGYYPIKHEIYNNDNLTFNYDSSYFYLTRWSIFVPWRYRYMKLIKPDKTYSFGYKLSRKDFNTIKELILEQREKGKEEAGNNKWYLSGGSII